ncbi:MAG: hypothetical protein JWR03_792 [Cohnella sp.]|nr:hypothetical protein [Cohnella sp.]
MFVYGQDIPLDDAVIEDIANPIPTEPVEPMEFPFEYGKQIFPNPSLDSSLT